jgi:hypothetical protein
LDACYLQLDAVGNRSHIAIDDLERRTALKQTQLVIKVIISGAKHRGAPFDVELPVGCRAGR